MSPILRRCRWPRTQPGSSYSIRRSVRRVSFSARKRNCPQPQTRIARSRPGFWTRVPPVRSSEGNHMLRTLGGEIVGYLVMAILITAIFIGAFLVLGIERAFQPDSYEISALWI